MKRIRISDPRAPELIEAVAADRECMPVRTLETVLGLGEPGMGMILMAMRRALERRRGLPPQWCAAALGRYGDPDVIPDLTALLRIAWRTRLPGLGFAAAEAIGRIGHPGAAMLLKHAGLTPARERFWFLYAAARVGTDDAADFLVREVERNLGLADAAAVALADMGRHDALPVIDRAITRARPWQISALEAAVLALHRRQPALGTYTEDWRLRYRYTPGFGHFPTAWPCLSAILRTHSPTRKVAARGVVRRGTATIIADDGAPPRTAVRCEVCKEGVARLHKWMAACDDCAPYVAAVQGQCLLDVDCRSNDIFDVLDTVDTFLMQRDMARADHDDDYRRHMLARAACHWLVEQGIESVAAGAAELLAEADASPVGA